MFIIILNKTFLTYLVKDHSPSNHSSLFNLYNPIKYKIQLTFNKFNALTSFNLIFKLIRNNCRITKNMLNQYNYNIKIKWSYLKNRYSIIKIKCKKKRVNYKRSKYNYRKNKKS